jgi:hypothetical protein
MARRYPLVGTTQTTLVDTFTCAIAILFVLLLSFSGASTQRLGIAVPDLILRCASRGAAVLFQFPSDDTEASPEHAQQRLSLLVPGDALSTRLTVKHALPDAACREAAQRLVEIHNESAMSARMPEAPYLVLDLQLVQGSQP